MSELCDNVCQNLESRKHRRKSLKSVCPSTIALWNDLPDEIRESDTMLSFKSRITPVVEKMPPYFEIAHRKLIILHARLRNFCSNLNYDLFRVNLTADPSCVCRNPCDNAFHFFFECPIYNMCHLEMENTMRISSIPMQTPTVKHTH